MSDSKGIKFCSECGSEVAAGVKFCSECGTATSSAPEVVKRAVASQPTPIVDRSEPEAAAVPVGASGRRKWLAAGSGLIAVVAIVAVVLAAGGSGGASGPTGVQTQCATAWNTAESESVQKGLPLTLELGVSLQTSGTSQANYNDSSGQQAAVDAAVSSAQVAVETEDGKSDSCLVTILYDQSNKAAQQDNGSSTGKEFYQYTFPTGWSSSSDPYGQQLRKLGPFPESKLYDSGRAALDSGVFQLRADPSPYVARSSALLIDGPGVGSDSGNGGQADSASSQTNGCVYRGHGDPKDPQNFVCG